jgi:hypothetical protein
MSILLLSSIITENIITLLLLLRCAIVLNPTYCMLRYGMHACYYTKENHNSVTPLEVDGRPEEHHLRNKTKAKNQLHVENETTAPRTILSEPGKSE